MLFVPPICPWHCYCNNDLANDDHRMEQGELNTYRFHGEVVEVIDSGEVPAIKLACKSGSMIIQIPYEENVGLGDRFLVTGRLKLILTEKVP